MSLMKQTPKQLFRLSLTLVVVTVFVSLAIYGNQCAIDSVFDHETIIQFGPESSSQANSGESRVLDETGFADNSTASSAVSDGAENQTEGMMLYDGGSVDIKQNCSCEQKEKDSIDGAEKSLEKQNLPWLDMGDGKIANITTYYTNGLVVTTTFNHGEKETNDTTILPEQNSSSLKMPGDMLNPHNVTRNPANFSNATALTYEERDTDDVANLTAQNFSSLETLDKSDNATWIKANFASGNLSHPLMLWKNGKLTHPPKLILYAWPIAEIPAKMENFHTPNTQHLLVDGAAESFYLEMTQDKFDFRPNLVWMCDGTGAKFGRQYPPCKQCFNRLNEAQMKRRERNMTALQWPVVLFNGRYRDSIPRCLGIEKLMGPENVHYIMRAWTAKRAYNRKTKWVQTGHLMSNIVDGREYGRWGYYVRSDIVKEVEGILAEKHSLELDGPIEKIERPIDVSHFWPLKRVRSHVERYQNSLRNHVSDILIDFRKKSNYTMFLDVVGTVAEQGRRNPSQAYVDKMMNTKIVVVTQRDSWEDHFRLFEALVSGALVMHDTMLSLPEGYKSGESYVEFTSENDLKAKLQYYLNNTEERQRIARHGYELAMTRHRSWHRLEEMIYGQRVTTCPVNDTKCPFSVKNMAVQ